MTRYRDQVSAALGAVTVLGPTRYTWLGRESRALEAEIEAGLSTSERRRYLVRCLQRELYTSFYCHGRPVPARWGAPEPVAADSSLVAAMSRANTGRGCWKPGWVVERVDGGEIVVRSSRLRARIAAANCRAASGKLAPGSPVSIRLPKELPERSPGFYTVVGDAGDAAGGSSTVRAYWNITRTGAPELVGSLSSRLNASGIPFRLKVADHPYRLHRCDAAVLYTRGDDFSAAAAIVREAAVALAPHLRPRVPAFTLELLAGVGLAEENGGGESFGERRCRLVADGIVRAHESGHTREDERFELVSSCFAEAGVRLEAPYLEPSLAGRHVL